MSEVAGTDNLASFREARFEPYFTHVHLFEHSFLPGAHYWMWRRRSFELHFHAHISGAGQSVNPNICANPDAYARTDTQPDANSNSDPNTNPDSNSDPDSHPNSDAREYNHYVNGRDRGQYERGGHFWNAIKR